MDYWGLQWTTIALFRGLIYQLLLGLFDVGFKLIPGRSLSNRNGRALRPLVCSTDFLGADGPRRDRFLLNLDTFLSNRCCKHLPPLQRRISLWWWPNFAILFRRFLASYFYLLLIWLLAAAALGNRRLRRWLKSLKGFVVSHLHVFLLFLIQLIFYSILSFLFIKFRCINYLLIGVIRLDLFHPADHIRHRFLWSSHFVSWRLSCLFWVSHNIFHWVRYESRFILCNMLLHIELLIIELIAILAFMLLHGWSLLDYPGVCSFHYLSNFLFISF